MIIGFLGNRGSGKTLSMTRELYKKYLEGYTIFSNYKLNFPHTKYSPSDIMEYAENQKKFVKSIFAVDEIHVYLDSRVSGRKINRVFSYFVTQTRKKDVDLYYTTQYPRQVDVRMRIHTDMVVECLSKSVIHYVAGDMPIVRSNYMMKGNEYSVQTYIQNTVSEFGYDNVRVIKYSFHANKYFKLYDTTEVIVPFKDED